MYSFAVGESKYRWCSYFLLCSSTSQVPKNIPKLGNGNVKKISLLGSTGSIGTQTLDIVEEHPDKFEVVALSAGGNLELVAEQVRVMSLRIELRGPPHFPLGGRYIDSASTQSQKYGLSTASSTLAV